ncbi:L2 [Gammapapillomavirus 11]|uniref:Minor capsid protein L2 n=1 Tax=Gammapapillomavirus 11 TaxID=1513256 RepID=A0A2D2ALL1_9PAPI|nr:L2 [Gammapapillomavirus 11]
MQRARRTKRASVTDIYKSCIQGGDCPTDVKNKVEGRTWADTLLKVFSSIIYLGGLGIGTGKGSGGSFGYRPFGGQGTRPQSNIPISSRPAIPTIDAVGPAEILPIGPDAPAIVPLEEGVPNIGIIDTPGGGPGLDADIVEITTAVDPVSEVTGVGEHPNITTGTADAAVIDVQVNPPPPKRILLESENPTFDYPIHTRVSHTDSDINVFVNPLFDGENIGPPEYIELDTFNTNERQTFEIDEGPKESTPIRHRIATRARDLYNRYIQQVPTRQPELVGLPSSRPFTTQFENPAFEADVRDIFQQDVEEFSLRTESQVTPRLTATPTGTIRASRLARKPGMTTRSGLDIGQRIHVYYDFSPIPKTSIELQTFGTTTGESTLVDELATSSFVNPFEENISGFPNDYLLDTLEENFSSTHLLVTDTGVEDDIEIPVYTPELNIKVFTEDLANVVTLPTSFDNATPIIVPSTITPAYPFTPIYVDSSDFELHPSLLKRKRKRSVF